jgi:serine/threonine protein kinase
MRCLNCLRDGVAMSAEVCPECGVHLPTLQRDLLSPGTLLHSGKYRLDYALGRGGFGITYRATHLVLDQLVAIKEFFPQEHASRDISGGAVSVPRTKQETYERSLKRFMSEGRVLAKLTNTNVVRVQDLFEERSTGYLVMDLIPGRTLDVVMREAGRLPEKQVWSIVDQLVSALEAVHKLGIYHLDIKPENVLLDADGRPILIDFGASRQGLGTQRSQSFTLEYAAPEVIAGGEVGPQSDLFELGMMVYEMVTGEKAPSAMGRLAAMENWEPKGLPPPWQELLVPALRVKRVDRPANVERWWKSQKPPEVVVPPRSVLPLTPPPKKSKAGVLFAVFGTFVAVLIIGGLLAALAGSLSENERLKRELTDGTLAQSNEITRLKNENETLTTELSNERARLNSLVTAFPVMIVGEMRLRNQDDKGNGLSGFTTSFSSSEIRYITWHITLQNNTTEKITGSIDIKYIGPDNVLSYSDKVARRTSDYSFKEDFAVESKGPGNVGQVALSRGWGNTDQNTFKIGTNRVELWFKDRLIGSRSFTVTP